MSENRFSSTALGAIRLAQANAARLGHSYVGSEHLLLGLACQEYSPPAVLLRRYELDSSVLRTCVAQLVGTGTPSHALHQGLTQNCRLIIRGAAAESRKRGQPSVSGEALLLSVLQQEQCGACRLLRAHGTDIAALRQTVSAYLGRGFRSRPALPPPGDRSPRRGNPAA